jgi:hypothetical protein
MTPEKLHYSPEEQHWFNVKNELFLLTSKRGIQGWAHIATCLLYEIARHYDLSTARSIFDWAGPMTTKQMQTQFTNVCLLERLARMQPKPNVAKLARELAEENKKLPKAQRRKLPKAQQRGAGSTDPAAQEDHIRHLAKIGRDKLWRRFTARSLGPSKLNK